MKNRSLLPVIGIIMYIILSIVDKFIFKVPSYVYIIIGIISIMIIIIGLIIDKKNKL